MLALFDDFFLVGSLSLNLTLSWWHDPLKVACAQASIWIKTRELDVVMIQGMRECVMSFHDDGIWRRHLPGPGIVHARMCHIVSWRRHSTSSCSRARYTCVMSCPNKVEHSRNQAKLFWPFRITETRRGRMKMLNCEQPPQLAHVFRGPCRTWLR